MVALYATWRDELKVTRETLRGFAAAVPEEWAVALQHGFPDIHVEDWEKVITAPPKPALRKHAEKRSMLGSKMELQNERVNKRVKIAATMTEDATKAKRALLEAGVTPQDVADSLGVGRSTVNAWCNGTRSIPKRYASKLLKQHRIPLDAWQKTGE